MRRSIGCGAGPASGVSAMTSSVGGGGIAARCRRLMIVNGMPFLAEVHAASHNRRGLEKR
jgi:hypothetical protein